MKKIILASASERRSRILDECGIEHEVVPSGVEETMGEKQDISLVVEMNAVWKAEEIAGSRKDAIVVGADTLVVHGADILGKPADEKEAKMMLRKFSGTDVDVYTGLCVIDASSGKKASGSEKSSLKVVKLAEEEVEKYFRLLGPYDKAGGFSIEGVGSLLFDNVRGSYFNILGLPMIKLRELFGKIGEDIISYVNVNG
jgi:septum formation protein